MRPLRTSLLALLVAAPASQAAAAPDSRVYSDVSPGVFACVKDTSFSQQGTIYVEAEDGHGTATTTSSLWSVVMDYAFTPETRNLEYWLVRKTWIVPADAIWSGIADMIATCRAHA